MCRSVREDEMGDKKLAIVIAAVIIAGAIFFTYQNGSDTGECIGCSGAEKSALEAAMEYEYTDPAEENGE